MRMNAFRVPKPFFEKFPEMKQERAETYLKKYLTMVRDELLRQLPYVDDGVVNINQDRLWVKQFNYKNKTYYIWKEFRDILPIVYIIDEGNNFKKRISKGKILNQKLVDLLIDSSDTSELVKMYYGDISETDMVMIPIDIKSLEGYIRTTEYNLENTYSNDKHRDKMLANLRTAKYVKLISNHYHDKYGYVLPHIPSKSIYGRMYYKGINLQNVSKEVRSAILGKHYQYDLYAAVFAIKLYLAEQICKGNNESFYGKFTYTKDYLENKDLIRSRLGSLIHAYPDGVKLAKQAITAIGFGARISNGSWNNGNGWQTSSLKSIIMNDKDFERFMNDNWLREFYREQHQLTDYIIDDYMKSQSFIDQINTLPYVKSVNGVYNKQKIMSYLFQNAETMIMDVITNDIDVIIRIHDAFLTKKKIPNSVFTDIKQTLYDTCQYFKIEMSEIEGWTNIDIVNAEIEHKEFIKREELLANNGHQPVKYSKFQQFASNQNDHKPYDGYDDGSRYEHYDMLLDESLEIMTLEEKLEHYRIIGYDMNSLPDNIKKLI
jgi:hypothetical protein